MLITALIALSIYAQTGAAPDPDAVTAKVAIDSLAQRLIDQTSRAVKAEQQATTLQGQLFTSQTQIAAYQATVADLKEKLAAAQAPDPVTTGKVAWVDSLDAKCGTCRDAIDAGISGKSGPLDGVLICCGPTTVPATKPDTAIVYIVPVIAAPVLVVSPAAVVK